MLSDYLEKLTGSELKAFTSRYAAGVTSPALHIWSKNLTPYRTKAPIPREYLKKALEAHKVKYYNHASTLVKLADKSREGNASETGQLTMHTQEPIGGNRYICFTEALNLGWGFTDQLLAPSAPKWNEISKSKAIFNPPPSPTLGDFLAKKTTQKTTFIYSVKKPFFGKMISSLTGLWVPNTKKYSVGDEVASLLELNLALVADTTEPVIAEGWSYPPPRQAAPGECVKCFTKLPTPPLFKWEIKGGGGTAKTVKTIPW